MSDRITGRDGLSAWRSAKANATAVLLKSRARGGRLASAQPKRSRHAGGVVFASVLSGYRDLVTRLGGDPDVLLGNVGLAPHLIDRPERKIGFPEYAELLEATAATLHCPDFGMRLADRQPPVSLMGPLEPLLRNAGTLGEMLCYSSHHMHIYSSAIRISVERFPADEGPFMRLEFQTDRVAYRRQVTEQLLAAAHAGAVSMSGGMAQPREIWFSHQGLASEAVYKARFRTKIRFAQMFDAIFFTEEAISSRIVESNEDVLVQQIQEITARFPQPSPVSAQVKAAISGSLFRPECGREDIAVAVGLHPRALQRRLHDEGKTFEGLKDEVRRDLAAHYLAQSDVPLTAVAARLGYAELAVLTRACQRWFGNSPTSLRKLLAAGDLA